jgi:hypothetical protein
MRLNAKKLVVVMVRTYAKKCALSTKNRFRTTGNYKCSTRAWSNHPKKLTTKKKKLSKKAMRKKYGYEALPVKKAAGKPVRVKANVQFTAKPSGHSMTLKRKKRVNYKQLHNGK